MVAWISLTKNALQTVVLCAQTVDFSLLREDDGGTQLQFDVLLGLTVGNGDMCGRGGAERWSSEGMGSGRRSRVGGWKGEENPLADRSWVWLVLLHEGHLPAHLLHLLP
jgi:hypothetical protein